LQTSITPTDFALPTGGRTWQTESVWITVAPDYDLHKHNPFATEDGIPMLVFQTLRTNPRAAWAGTCVVGVISGVVAGYTFDIWTSNFFEAISPGLSLGLGLGLYFFALGRATAVMAVFYAAAIAFAYYAAVRAGFWWYGLFGDWPYDTTAATLAAAFFTFAAIIAVASAVSFRECRNAPLCLALIGISTFAGTLMYLLLFLVDEILGIDVDAVAWSLVFVFLEGSIAAVIGYGLFLTKPNDSRKERV
jgi:hypothetical protein